jgi:predicted HTH domain antitoxin
MTGDKMGVLISDDILLAIHMDEAELLKEIAVLLYEKDRLTLGQASKLARTSQLQFQHVLASRGIPVHYGVADFEQDLTTLKDLGR